jgi:hypothetical protein
MDRSFGRIDGSLERSTTKMMQGDIPEFQSQTLSEVEKSALRTALDISPLTTPFPY